MGLAGRKQKQRIPADPRNLGWADDASRFGLSYLSKFGWDSSQGLGSSGDGTKSHLKVHQKLDMMGIGAQHQRDPNGIAWKQSKDFEALLKRLNDSAGKDTEGEKEGSRETVIVNGFLRAHEQNPPGELGNESTSTVKKRKRKDAHDDENTSKKRKERKEKDRRSGSDGSAALSFDSSSGPPLEPSASDCPSESMPKPRPMAHRARIRAAKRLAGKSASAISEILGIAPSSSTSTPTLILPPSTPIPQPAFSVDNLTTSTKSVADYFREKLLARSSTSSSSLSGSATPGLGSSYIFPPDEDESPRRGIGSRDPAAVPGSHVPGSGSVSGAIDRDTGAQDTLTEKQRRKAERKAEKRRQRKAEVDQALEEDVSTSIQVQTWQNSAERMQGTKAKKRREQEQQAQADQPSDNGNTITEQVTSGGAVPKPKKKTKKERKVGGS